MVERQKAARLLHAGDTLLGPPEAERHVVLSASTPEGLAMLAADLGTDLIVFGSDTAHRTATFKRVHGQALARRRRVRHRAGPAGCAGRAIRASAGSPRWPTTGVSRPEAIARGSRRARGEVGASPEGADVLVLASRPDSPAGQVQLSSAVRGRLDEAMVPVIVLPTGRTLAFSG